MKTHKFKVLKREETGKENAKLYAEALTAGVVYGPELKENINIKMREADIRNLYKEIGESSIVELEIEGETEPMEVLIKDIAYDPVKMLINHIDFYKIKRGQKIEANVAIVIIGDSPAVKALGGVLSQTLSEISIKCLPKDLIHEIEIDISGLKSFDDSIYVRDLNLSEDVEILDSVDDHIISVTPPRIEQVVVATTDEAEEGAEGDKPAADGEKKDEKSTEEKK